MKHFNTLRTYLKHPHFEFVENIYIEYVNKCTAVMAPTAAVNRSGTCKTNLWPAV